MILDIENATNRKEQFRLLRMFLYLMKGLSLEQSGAHAYAYKESMLKLIKSTEVSP